MIQLISFLEELNSVTQKEKIHYNKKKFEKTWKLTDHINTNDEDVSRYRTVWAFKRFFVECIPYLLWIILLTVAALHNTQGGSSRSYWFGQNLNNRFVNSGFLNIQVIQDFWNWNRETFVPALTLLEFHAEGQPINELPEEFMSGNKLVGLPLMRQFRVVNNEGCTIPSKFGSSVVYCYPTNFIENRDTYGPPGYVGLDGTTPFVYKSNADSQFWGQFDDIYPKGGFVQLIYPDLTKSSPILTDLENNSWIDSNTRLVLISMAVYNVNYNMLGILRLALEFPGRKTLMEIKF